MKAFWRMTEKITSIIKGLMGAALLSLAGVALLTLGLWHWGQQGYGSGEDPTLITVKPSMSVAEFSYHLASQTNVGPPALTSLYIKMFDAFEEVKSGRYLLPPHDSLQQIMDKLKKGETHKQQTFKVTIPEGFTMRQVAARLERHRHSLADGKHLTAERLMARMSEGSFLASLGIKAPTIEGYLYPETYAFFEVKPTSTQVISRMVKELFSHLTPELRSAFKARGISVHEALIMASMIEKETSAPEERNKVSEVIWSRWKKAMPLGIDAAVIYGIKDYGGDLTFAHLKDKSNLYNTRVHRGLPPTPIGATSLASLLAVTTPTKHGYLYYVLIPGSGGRHHFSRTYKEHNRHLRRLVRATSPS